MEHSITVAVIGASQLAGQAILEQLAQANIAIEKAYAIDTAEHTYEECAFGNLSLEIQSIEDFDFALANVAIFAAGAEISKQYVQDAIQAGAKVIDFSSVYRMQNDVPLIVSQINADQLGAAGEASDLISIPNCTVTPLACALASLRSLQINRVTVSTYQSVSGAGQSAMEELANQTTSLFNQKDAEVNVFAKRIAFNILPQIGELDEAGVSEEEKSVETETARVLNLPASAIEATCVRVPVFFGHAWSVAVKLDQASNKADIEQLMQKHGLQVVNVDHAAAPYVTQMEAVGNNGLWVSRLRVHGDLVRFWLAADNTRVGIANNCVGIVEKMIQLGYFSA